MNISHGPREECGVFGVFVYRDAAKLTYFGLYALQHRGQESAGIVSSTGKSPYEHKGMGLVPEVFNESILTELCGDLAVGHVRYSTTGSSTAKNAQPFVVSHGGNTLAIAHNGNLTNAREVRSHLEQMSREDFEAFVEDMQDRGLEPETVRTRLCAVYAFVHFLIERKVLNYELLERKIKLKLPDRLPRAIDPEDVAQLLSVINNTRDRALILLLLRTGMRIGELLNCTVNDVDVGQQKILIYQSDKTSGGRVVYYSEDAQAALLAWLRIRDPFKEKLFYGQGRHSLCYEAARSMFTKYLHKAGLHGCTLHCLRHTFATDLLNVRMPLECLRVLLGHTNLEVTRRYARLTDTTREHEYFKAMERILNGELD